MKFRDLMALPHEERNGVVDVASIRLALPDAPGPVIKQVYSQHGRLAAFQSVYGDVEISRLMWKLQALPAEAICQASHQFDGHVKNVSARAESALRDGWSVVDRRPEVVQSWRDRGTWLMPPV